MSKTTAKNKDDQAIAVKAQGGALAAYDYSQYAGQGFEEHTRDDYATPFLGILQSNSPIVETKAEAKAGMLINTVTQDMYDGKKGLIFIPAATQHKVVEWKPREQGGGFVATHEMESELVNKARAEQEFGKWKSKKGDVKSNDLIETFYVYGICVDESGNSPEQMMIAFSSTKIKVYKRWMTKARTVQIALPDGRRINPPLFAHKYRISSANEKNAKGSFYNYAIDFEGGSAEKARLGTNDPLFQAAVGFNDLIKSGNVKAAYESQSTVGAEPVGEEEIPFK